jgi:hypothetical protein
VPNTRIDKEVHTISAFSIAVVAQDGYGAFMARARKRQVQQAIRFPDKNGQWRGGARRGAGRPKRGRFASERHGKRPELTGREPVLITVRVGPGAGNLRRRAIYPCVRGAMQTAWARPDFRIVHLSIQGTHLHLITEAASQHALSRGMQGFLISAARRINRAVSKQGGEAGAAASSPTAITSA